ncbi:MAG: hydrolase [Candidatus Kapabacteria bacterium]|nr:hydrolase [Candidatus Kapabacteria bacterium]
MRLDASHSMALCIDLQERLFPHINGHDELADRCSRLIRGLRALNVPIVVTEQYVKGLGSTIAPISEALGDYEPLEKMSFSCCGVDAIEARVLGARRHTMILFGIETHVCVLQTALDLLAQGQTVVVVEDCVSSRNANDKRIAIERMRSHGAIITTMESILFELLRVAGTDTFKAISAIVK